MRKVISFDKNLEFKTMIGEVTSISLEPSLEFSSDSDISGELVISGKYKLTAASRLEDDFLFSLPIEIALSEKLEEDSRKVSIDDFRYEVEDSDILKCHIDLVVEGVEKIELDEEEDRDFSLRDNLGADNLDVLKESVESVEYQNNVEEMKENVSSHSSFVSSSSSDSVSNSNSNAVSNFNVSLPKNTTSDTSSLDESGEEEEGNSIGEDSTYSLFSSFKESDESFSTYSVYIMRENDTLDTVLSKYKIHREELEDYNDLEHLIVGTKLIIPTEHE